MNKELTTNMLRKVKSAFDSPGKQTLSSLKENYDMKATNFLKLAMAAALVIGIGTMVSQDTKAETGTIGSSVSIGIPVAISGDFDLLWGTLVAPSSGTDNWTINCAGALSGGASVNDLFPTDHQIGQFTISGEPLASVTFSVAVTSGLDFNSGDANLLLKDPVACVTSPDDLDGSGDLVVEVGASLDVSAGANSGSHTDGEITMTANYN